MSSNDHYACEIRYRDLLHRLEEMSARIERTERHQRTILDLLGDVRDLVRLMATRIREAHQRIDAMAAPLMPFSGLSERITRHFRN